MSKLRAGDIEAIKRGVANRETRRRITRAVGNDPEHPIKPVKQEYRVFKLKPKKNALCKGCGFRTRANGSSRCDKCKAK